MKRLLLLAALLSISALAAVGYSAWTREQTYRRLVAESEAASASGDALAAIEALSGAIALRPDSMLAWLRRGELYRKQQDYAAAIRDLRQASQLDPGSPRPEEQLGDVHLARQFYSSAAEHFAKALALDDRNARALYKLGLACLRDGKLQRAEEAFRRAVAIEPARADTHYLLGTTLSQLGRHAQAAQAFERALALDASTIPAREALAIAYERLGRHADALRQHQALARREPDRPERLVAVGLDLARLGRTDEAIVLLARTASQSPESPLVLDGLGRVWLEAGLAHSDRVALSKAVEALKRAIERTPSGDSLGRLGRASLALGDRAAAFRYLQSASSYVPVSPQVFDWLADAAEAVGRPVVARDALLRAAALSGDRVDQRTLGQRTRRIGLLSYRAGDAATAATWLTRAASLQPQDTEVKKALDQLRRNTASQAGASPRGRS